jgi:hypothetical protein
MAWRQNAGRLRVERGGKVHLYQFAGAAGVSDVLAILPPHGRLLAVETKMPGRKLTADQAAFLSAVTQAGGVALVVRDLKDLERALDELGRL